MVKGEKLTNLEKSYEDKVISKEEYEKKKKEIEKEPEKKYEEKEEKEKKQDKGSDKALIIGIISIIIFFAVILLFLKLSKETPKTIDELHALNIQGKLKPEQGYMYKGAFSFLNIGGFWYTQLTSYTGKRLYDMSFRYDPAELEDIEIEGVLDVPSFDNSTEYYMTFNPEGKDFSHVALAVGDINDHMLKVFGKKPIAACDRYTNETEACVGREIIYCENTDKIVFYVKEAEESRVYYDGNCIVIEGNGFDLVRGADRVLYNLYGIMER